MYVYVCKSLNTPYYIRLVGNVWKQSFPHIALISCLCGNEVHKLQCLSLSVRNGVSGDVIAGCSLIMMLIILTN